MIKTPIISKSDVLPAVEDSIQSLILSRLVEDCSSLPPGGSSNTNNTTARRLGRKQQQRYLGRQLQSITGFSSDPPDAYRQVGE
eukprot:6665726-Ditylum_brightwellii.AAC.1